MRLVLDEDYRAGECGTRKLRWDLISKALCRWSADGHTVRQRFSLLEHWTGAARILLHYPSKAWVATRRSDLAELEPDVSSETCY